jgi:hypothetical protein
MNIDGHSKVLNERLAAKDESSNVRVGQSPFSGAKSTGGGGTGAQIGSETKGQRDGEVGNIYHLFEKKDGVPSKKAETDPFPVVDWVSIEKGGRASRWQQLAVNDGNHTVEGLPF